MEIRKHFLENDITVYECEIPVALDLMTASDRSGYHQSTKNVRAESRRSEIIVTNLLIKDIFGPKAVLCHEASGAPYVEVDGSRSDKCISISHSNRYAVVAVSPRQAGIDVEEPHERVMRVREKFLSPEELRFTGTSVWRTTLAWTAKEALFKCIPESGVDFIGDLSLSLSDIREFAPTSLFKATAYGRPYRLMSHFENDRIFTLAVPDYEK